MSLIITHVFFCELYWRRIPLFQREVSSLTFSKGNDILFEYHPHSHLNHKRLHAVLEIYLQISIKLRLNVLNFSVCILINWNEYVGRGTLVRYICLTFRKRWRVWLNWLKKYINLNLYFSLAVSKDTLSLLTVRKKSPSAGNLIQMKEQKIET